MYDRQELYIGGRWRAASGSNKIEVDEAATGRTFGSVPVATDDDLHEAVAAARGAFDGWSQTPVAERAGLLRAIASGLEAREDELATVMAREVGTPIAVSRRVQVGLGVAVLRSMADDVEALPAQEWLGS